MFLLQALESLLGSVETWPTTILKRLFVDESTHSAIKTVSAFLYGNGVPCTIASYFYNLCNEQGGAHTTDTMQTYYFIWQASIYSSDQSIYYNTALKRFMWIRGRGLGQMEPHVSDVPLGLERTGFATFIRIK